MGNLREAIQNEAKWTETDNGAVALNTTLNKCLDFFGVAGSLRGADKLDKLTLFDAAFKQDKDIAVKLLFYTRDVRGGYGERDTFNEIFAHLAQVNPESVRKNLWAVLEFGRAKDLYSLIGTPCEEDMWKFMRDQFEIDLDNMAKGESVSLLAKWIATPDSHSEKTAALGKKTAKMLGYNFKTMKEYKVKLRSLRKYLDLPEAKMCAGKWNEIEYSKCASRFMLTHKEAFKRHDNNRYNEFIQRVNSGAEDMHMGTVTPCDIIQKVFNGSYTSDLEAMWKSLPDMNNGNALVICDTSGSMWCDQINGVYPGTVAFALAIYFAERNKGCLKDMFMTFSSEPEFIQLNGATLVQKYRTLYESNWGSSTDLKSAYDLLLRTAVNGHLSQEDMPDALVIISDMQINCVYGIDDDNKMTFHDAMKLKFERAGYKMPHTVFWNVNAQRPVFHASGTDAGVSFASGYATNVFKQILDNIGTTPTELMMAVVESERYKDVIA